MILALFNFTSISKSLSVYKYIYANNILILQKTFEAFISDTEVTKLPIDLRNKISQLNNNSNTRLIAVYDTFKAHRAIKKLFRKLNLNKDILMHAISLQIPTGTNFKDFNSLLASIFLRK